MHKLVINGEIQYAQDGTILSDVLIKNEKRVEHPCGGKGSCKKCIVNVNGENVLSCQYEIHSDCTVLIPENGSIVSETGADETGVITEKLCFALDIGTTTLALALVSVDEGKIIKVITRTNPQRIFGADIMTRVDYCRRNGIKDLQNTIIAEINSMISEFDLHNIKKLFVSGNATMLHIFFGIDCSSMGVAPYTPVFLESKTVKGESIGINNIDTVESLPSISAFVGADLVAGLNYVPEPEKGKYNLLIDLGTNAEIILFSEKSALCTAAAAGPCFEGANISSGMSATDGAVYSYSHNGIKTVGNSPAKGICGTGLIDIIAEFIKNGTIDKTGFMECETFEIADGVIINQADIRQYQLAKSAVYSAIMTLILTNNISFDEIDNVYISGGFSAKINIENAVITGLLPKEFVSKCVAVNNSSLLGTVKFACDNNNLSGYVAASDYVDLSSNAVFSDLFIRNMMFDTI